MKIDVSGHNHSCGLYSLALAVNLALKGQQFPDCIPVSIQGITEEDVQSGSKRLKDIDKDLRAKLADAMLKDPDFKSTQRDSFYGLCLPGESSPIDKEAFTKGAVEEIKKIKEKVVALLTEDKKYNYQDAIDYCPKSTITMLEIDEFLKELKNVMTNDFTQGDINNLLDKKLNIKEIDTLYNICYIFNQAWGRITEQEFSDSKRNEVKALVVEWFDNHADQLLTESQKDKNGEKTRKLLLNLGNCTRWVNGIKDLGHNARKVYASYFVRKEWDVIFGKYVTYVKDKSVFLSVEELSCLAKVWKVALYVENNNKLQPYANAVTNPIASIGLTNPSEVHWMVRTLKPTPSSNLSDKKDKDADHSGSEDEEDLDVAYGTSSVESVHQTVSNPLLAGLRFERIERPGLSLFPAIARCLNQDVSSLRTTVANYLESHLDKLWQYRPNQKKSGNDSASAASAAASGLMSHNNIDPRRKSLRTTEANFIQAQLASALPTGKILGAAYDDGDCFFDALAQILNSTHQKDINTSKYLRMLCHDFYTKNPENKRLVDSWHTRDFNGLDKGREDYFFIQYTAEELEGELKGQFKGRSAIWGRPIVEGRILCRQLNLPAIVVIEVLKDPESDKLILSFNKVTIENYTQIGDDEAQKLLNDAQVPTVVVTQDSLHFVPFLKAPIAAKATVSAATEDPQLSFKQYIQHIHQGRERGDNIELQLVQQAIGRPIVVIYSNKAPTILGADEHTESEPIFLHSENTALHYDVFTLREDANGKDILTQIQIAIGHGQLVIFDLMTQFNEHSRSVQSHSSFEKNLLLSRGFAGSVYQVKILMLYAFEAYCSGKPFYLYTEAEGFGKFDDCVLFREDTMQVLQAKHSFDPSGRYSLENLIGDDDGKDEKKAVLNKYFDSWLQIEFKRYLNPDKYRGKIEYIFFTNHGLDADSGLAGLYDESTQKFSNDFLSGEGLDKIQKSAREQLLISIYDYIDKVKKDILKTFEELIKRLDPSIKQKVVIIQTKETIDKKQKVLPITIRILLSLLWNKKCLIEDTEKKSSHPGRKIYKFSKIFIENDENLPPILIRLREQVFKRENFNSIEKISCFRFETADSNFYDGTTKTNYSSLIDQALCTGYLGLVTNEIFENDFSDSIKLASGKIIHCVENFFEQFIFKIKQPNEAEMTKVLEDKIGKHFNMSDRSYYLYFYESMLNFLLQASGKAATEQDIKEIFSKAKAIFERNMLVGYGKRYEYHLEQTCRILLTGQYENNLVKPFLESEKNIMVYYAEHDFTVAMSVYDALKKLIDLKELTEDGYSFIDADYAVLEEDHSIFQTKDFKLLVIDHAAHLDTVKLKSFIETVIKYKKKLILLCRSDKKEQLKESLSGYSMSIDDSNFKKLCSLKWSVVNDNIQSNGKQEQGVMLGSRFIAFASIEKKSTLSKIMQNPYHLSAMLTQAVSQPTQSTSLYPSKRFFVKPTLIFQTPIYEAKAILSIQHKIIRLDKGDLSKIKQILAIDLNEIIEKYSDKTLKDIINSIKDQDSPEPEALCIRNSAAWDNLNDKLKQELGDFKRLIFIGENNPKELGEPLKLTQVGLHYKLDDPAMYQYMPETSSYLKESEGDQDTYRELSAKKGYNYRSIILSDYGSGKSHLTEQLLEERDSSSFNWIVRIPLKTLDTQMANWTIKDLAEYYLSDTQYDRHEWQRDLLEYDIAKGNVLWVLDGFDEMGTDQRNKLNKLICELAEQPNCLIASRPNAAAFIPFQPNHFVVLEPFNDKQITEFVSKFFTENQLLQQKASELIKLWKTKNSLQLLGKPLMCHIACNIISDNHMKLGDLQDVTLSKLFDYFMQVNFRKYHHDHNAIPLNRLIGSRLYHLSSTMLSRLKKVAYIKLFNRPQKNTWIVDTSLDTDIQCLGLVSKIFPFPGESASDYTFDHQTQVEYFAALYWVEQLLDIPVDNRIARVKSLWTSSLYNTELRVVWQFIAGIVSSEHNLFLEGKGIDVLDAFCALLLESSEDLVGKVHKDILSSCYYNMNLLALSKTPYADQWKTKIEEINANTITPPADDEIIKIRTHRGQGHQVDSDEQVVEEFMYTKLHCISELGRHLRSLHIENDIEGLIKPDEILDNLSQIKHLLDTSPLTPENIIKIRDIVFELYKTPPGSQSGYGFDYEKAYAMITAMIDNDKIRLEDCVEVFTENFAQKNCLLDILKRLKQKKLLTKDHINKLFSQEYPRFWDLDAGLPAILLLKSFFCQSMGKFLQKNIVDRRIGDWEIERAINILIKLIEEPWDIERFNILMGIVYNPGSEIDKSKLKEIKQKLVQFQGKDCIIGFIREKLISATLEDQKNIKFALSLLYDFCCHYDLALTLESNRLNIRGRINATIDLPQDHEEIMSDFVRFEMFVLRGGNPENMPDTLNDIKRKLEVSEKYHKFLTDNKERFDNEELNILSTISKRLEFPKALLTELKKDCESMPDKNTFANKVGVLSAFEGSLNFIDEFYKNLPEASGWWDIDAGIPAAARFGNYFNEGAYCYLKKFSNDSYRQTKNAYCETLKILSNSKLSEKNAIKHLLLLLIESRVFTHNEENLNDLGNEIVGNSDQLEGLRGFDENALIEAFIDLLKGKDRKSAEFKKLKLLSKYWDKKIQEQLEGSIQKAKPIEKPTPSAASFFYSLHKHFPKQAPEQLSVVGNRLRAYSV